MSFNFVRIIHCVTLEVVLIHFKLTLIVCHNFEINIMSELSLSSSLSIETEISLPVLVVTAIAFTPLHHLF
ncbi:MAG: hypothetical protein LBU14_02250 [Candidatus Peribacteria bacterium]|nr:hypothetical protein [Candidatus Peribacteria bacterium]